jgi:hypothetical protein
MENVLRPNLSAKNNSARENVIEASEKVIARSEATKQSFQNINKIKIASSR